jgi:predicted AlkP superfamily pyrophosphatase or phosphodiesterase
MKRLLSLLLVLVLANAAFAADGMQGAKPARPFPALDHVVIISVDGLRPDRLLLADAPRMHALIHDGSYTFWAKTTALSTTLPSHTSMLTGVNPRKHGVEWNDTLPFSQPVYPKFPTIFELAKQAGYTTGMLSGKPKFDIFLKPGIVDYAHVPKSQEDSDEPVGDTAVEVIKKSKPDLLFVHFQNVDRVGHASGWGSDEQLAAIAQADTQIGRILDALGKAGLRASTLIIVTADHGGAGLSHGPEDPRSRHIPWIACGPGVKRFMDLTQDAQLEVRTEDTFATAAYVLGLPLDPKLDGRPVKAIFEEQTDVSSPVR